MSSTNKFFLLMKTLCHSPSEFLDRIEAILTSRLERYFPSKIDYNPLTAENALQKLSEVLGHNVNWNGIEDFEANVVQRMQSLEEIAPFSTKHHGDLSLARLCFAVCRLLKPEIVIETGVAYGVTTAYMLKALQMNGNGVLHSIDLPPLGKNADAFVGYLIPEELKERWVLHRGTSKRILPSLLDTLKHVDIFVHDGLHTYWNIKRELNAITPYLTRPSVVIADDVEENKAFYEWAVQVEPKEWFTFKEKNKDSIAGVAVFM
nr:class I SAM-dependent methyltransferase [Ardenticatena sp.]